MPTLEWSVEKCLKKCKPTLFLDQAIGFSKTRIKKSRNVTFSEMQEAYKQLAKIITIYGDQYLPLFERLHSEITEYRSKNELLNIAKRIAHEKLSTEKLYGENIKNISHIFSHVSHTNIFR